MDAFLTTANDAAARNELGLGAFFDTSGVLTFPATASPGYANGRLVYDSNNDCLTFFNSESEVALQIGQETLIRVRNNSGATITNGQAVYFSGALTGVPTIALARADAITTTIVPGIATHDIENNTYGYIAALGTVRGVNMTGFTAGQSLYLSATTAGAFTNVAPSAPNYRFRIGIVASAGAMGSIHVTPSTGALGNGTANQLFGMNTAGTGQETKSLLGTANEITATGGTGTITFSLPSAMTFTGKTITGGTYASPTFTTPALGTPSSGNLASCTGYLINNIGGLGTGVFTALSQNVGTSGAFVTFGGALGTPSSGTVTNLTGTGSININGTVGATTPNTGSFTTLTASGTTTLGMASASSASFPPFLSTRTTSSTSGVFGAAQLIALSSADVIDGFGPSVSFGLTDTGVTAAPLGSIGAVRSGADNTGDIVFNTSLAGSVSEAMRVKSNNKLLIGYTADQGTGLLQINGGLGLDKTITPAGTTGARTINKPAGSVNFAASATSLVVTNSLVTANSVIVATLGNDSTAKAVSAVPTAGSFTLRPNTAPTAEVPAYFLVIN